MGGSSKLSSLKFVLTVLTTVQGMESTASHGSMAPQMQRGISGVLPTHGSQPGARAPREA